MRTESRSITIAASPATVFGYVVDPRNLPVWAPAFARAVRPDGDQWIVTNDAGEFPIVVRASAEHQFTLFFPDGTDEAAVEEQMTTVEGELEAVRAGCE